MTVIKSEQKLQEGRLISRENRFVAIVELDGQEVRAYVPNPGRMEELMVLGARVFLSYHPEDNRKTKYNLLLVEYNDRLISIDSHLPNKLVAKALNERCLAEFSDYDRVKAEYNYGNSRLDFLLEGQKHNTLIEVKSATLVEEGVAKFPDAPTKRGRRHLDELIAAKREGYQAVVIFIIQRDDAIKFVPHQRIDLKFAKKLKEAVNKGVKAYAYNCQISTEEVSLNQAIPIEL